MVSVNSIEMYSIKDVVDDSEAIKVPETRRHFEYNLNDKNAKAKLIKGAKRETLDVVQNKGSCNVVFSTGSWSQIVLPSILYWKQSAEYKTCKLDEMEIKIVSIKTGKDVVGKHIDTQIIFVVNKKKVVCHFYNTTQLILVNGQGYENFVEFFLQPYFESKISLYEEDILNYNNLVLQTLGKKMVKRSDIKYNGGSTFPCTQCDFAGKTLTVLEKHKKKGHSISFIASSTETELPSTSLALKTPMHSTRNNSFSEVMLENMSITNISNESKKDESLKYTCLECNFITKEKGCMDAHVVECHGLSVSTVLDFICGICKHEFTEADDYNKHVQIHEVKPEEAIEKALLKEAKNVDKVTTLDESVIPTMVNEKFKYNEFESVLPGLRDLSCHVEVNHGKKN